MSDSLRDPMDCSMSPTISWSLLKFMTIDSVMLSNNLILCGPLFLLLSVFPSIRVFSDESALTSHGKSIRASAVDLPMNIQCWFPLGLTDLLAVQGTLKNLFQHHSLKASILQCWAFFMVQLSHLYMTTGKNIALTIQTFVGKMMSLLSKYSV